MVIIGAIIIGILIIALMFLYNIYLEKYNTEDFNIGMFAGIGITLFLVIEVSLVSDIIEKPNPSAIDVYRGNTELEIKSVNGISIDTVVIFKEY